MYRGWIWAVFVAFDQLGNALCGGHPDITVSARLYHVSAWHGRLRWARFLVDLAFRPADGEFHCHNSFRRETKFARSETAHERMQRGNDIALTALAALVVLFVPVLFLVNCLRWLVGRFR